MAQVFGYSTWQKFNWVFNKALQVAQNRGLDMSEHFNQTVEMVRLGSGSFREVDNWHLLMGRYMRRESLKKKQLLENFQ